MKWHELTPIINAVVCGIVSGLFAGVFLYLKNRMKVDFSRRRVKILSGLVLFCVLFGALTLKTFIVEKYDFRGKWEAYQFRKTMIEPEAFEPLKTD